MSEPERPARSEEGAEEPGSEVSQRVKQILAEAQATADLVREQAAREAKERRKGAEEDAKRLVDEARAQAERISKERVRRIEESSDPLVTLAEKLVAQLDKTDETRARLAGLVTELGDAADGVAGGAKTMQASLAEAPGSGAARRRFVPAGALGARVVAQQMADAGGSRLEVEAHLRRAFDLQHPRPILDAVFETADGSSS